MKKVEAIIKPFKLDEVKDALGRRRCPWSDQLLRLRVSVASAVTRNSIKGPSTWLTSFQK